MYCDASLTKYLDDLAARFPAPGGGSAAALTAALGASLISMVVNFTLGKPKYAAYQEELEKVIKKSEGLRREFLSLTDLDVVAYKNKNIRDTLGVPLKVCRLSHEGIKLCPPLIKKGNINLISDVAVAAVLLEAAFSSAYFNVEINLQSSDDVVLEKGKIRKELVRRRKQLIKIRKSTEIKVDKIIRG